MTNVIKEEYWTTILNDPTQIGQITTEDTEFNRRINDVNLVLSNTFINSSNENLISKWETSLYIDETEGKTITERKANILYTLCEKNYVPVSIIKRFLLNLIGEESGFVIEFRRDEMKLIVRTNLLTDDKLQTIDELLDKVVPRNIEVYRDPFPLDYTKVDYLENTSNKSYIDLQHTQSAATGYKAVWSYPSGGNFGVIRVTSNGGFSYTAVTNQLGANIYYNFYNKQFFTSMKSQQDIIYTHELNFLHSKESRLYCENNEEITDLKSVVWTDDCAGKVLMWRLESLSNIGHLNKVYSSCVSEGDVLVRDMVPALDNVGAPCMFDLVSGKPFYNSGTGDFLYPTDTAPVMSTDLDDKFYAQLTAHGVRRMYKVPDGCNMTKDEYAAANGFKELVEPPMPAEGYWVPEWRETETQLILEWIENEIPPTEYFNLEQSNEN